VINHRKFQFIKSIIFSFWLSACSQSLPPSTTLPIEVAETSGLVCLNNRQFLTINDSGHRPSIFQINDSGVVKRKIDLAVANNDWEAISTDGTWLYIADTGNNSGARQEGFVYRVRLKELKGSVVATRFTFRFSGYTANAIKPYQHEFDIEAIATTKTDLFMFNKNWTGGATQVYQLPTSAGLEAQTLSPIAKIYDLPGVVTDATWSERHQIFLLAGYANPRSNALALYLTGNFSAFIAVVDQNFQVIRTIPVPEARQLEGICLDEDDNIWLSQEQFQNTDAKLWRFTNLKNL
jgi:hypothetical protein